MVADLFTAAGWQALCPAQTLTAPEAVDLIMSHPVQVLALSVTLTVHLNAAEQFIAAIRASSAGRVYILAGGTPFNLVPHLWRRIGADGSASTAQTAVRLAQQLFPQQ
jgi:methylmalonyl-CoA mutase cobalamin-binding subunit